MYYETRITEHVSFSNKTLVFSEFPFEISRSVVKHLLSQCKWTGEMLMFSYLRVEVRRPHFLPVNDWVLQNQTPNEPKIEVPYVYSNSSFLLEIRRQVYSLLNSLTPTTRTSSLRSSHRTTEDFTFHPVCTTNHTGCILCWSVLLSSRSCSADSGLGFPYRRDSLDRSLTLFR